MYEVKQLNLHLAVKPQTICSLLFAASSVQTMGTKFCCYFSCSVAHLWQWNTLCELNKRSTENNVKVEAHDQKKNSFVLVKMPVSHWFHHRWCRHEEELFEWEIEEKYRQWNVKSQTDWASVKTYTRLSLQHHVYLHFLFGDGWGTQCAGSFILCLFTFAVFCHTSMKLLL